MPPIYSSSGIFCDVSVHHVIIICLSSILISSIVPLCSQAVIAKAQDKRRILVNLGLFAFTLIGCVIAIISGKRLKKKGGYSLQDRNRQRYEKARERDAKAKQQ